MSERFYGKYVGVVEDNKDPKGLSRLKVRVPEVFGEQRTGWCLPSAPYAGKSVGFAAVPPNGSLVFVEWPAGDTSRAAIWSGASWIDGGGVAGASPEVFVIQTASHRIELKDANNTKEITISAATNAATITMNDKKLSVAFGKMNVEIDKSSVSINGGALKVT
jgi:uncharacterized protein involved in type VI secretion and phage assembly